MFLITRKGPPKNIFAKEFQVKIPKFYPILLPNNEFSGKNLA